jgi:hypothetical protein
MADDDELDEELDDELDDPDLEDGEIDEEEIDEDLGVELDEELDEAAVVETEDFVEGAAPEAEPEPAAPRARKKRDDVEEDDDDDVLNPDDVEADLDTILRDRIAATDDDVEDEDEEEDTTPSGTADPSTVAPKRAGEFTCPGCFLLVNRAQFGRAGRLLCPVGNDPCPAIEQIEAGG